MYYDFFNPVILKTSCRVTDVFKVKHSIYHSRGEKETKISANSKWI